MSTNKILKPFTKKSYRNNVLHIVRHSFDSIEEAVNELHLDRRFKYDLYGNELVYSIRVTVPCSGCNEWSEGKGENIDYGGCSECGYTGKVRNYYPQPIHPNGKAIKINCA